MIERANSYAFHTQLRRINADRQSHVESSFSAWALMIRCRIQNRCYAIFIGFSHDAMSSSRASRTMPAEYHEVAHGAALLSLEPRKHFRRRLRGRAAAGLRFGRASRRLQWKSAEDIGYFDKPVATPSPTTNIDASPHADSHAISTGTPRPPTPLATLSRRPAAARRHIREARQRRRAHAQALAPSSPMPLTRHEVESMPPYIASREQRLPHHFIFTTPRLPASCRARKARAIHACL